jgi:MtfA peptidase
MIFPWLKARRRQQLLSDPFPLAWREVLKQNVRHFQFLNSQQRQRMEEVVVVMHDEKDWAGGGGFEVTDAMKVTIAGYAAVMTLGLTEPYYFDRLMSIIVYPGAYQPQQSDFTRYPEFFPPGARLGEAWHHGPVVLSWAEIAGTHKLRPGNNLVIHEFAHHIDGLDGDVDGKPPIAGRENSRTWYRVTEMEFERLKANAHDNVATLLDRYGATNRAEFFAVASECYFERPHAMRHFHAELYQVLANFYCQDPASWLADAT